MKRTSKLLKTFFMLGAITLAADKAMAFLPGPFEFGFANGFLNSLFLLPFTVGGCL
jgi:hypothetical protein